MLITTIMYITNNKHITTKYTNNEITENTLKYALKAADRRKKQNFEMVESKCHNKSTSYCNYEKVQTLHHRLF